MIPDVTSRTPRGVRLWPAWVRIHCFLDHHSSPHLLSVNRRLHEALRCVTTFGNLSAHCATRLEEASSQVRMVTLHASTVVNHETAARFHATLPRLSQLRTFLCTGMAAQTVAEDVLRENRLGDC